MDHDQLIRQLHHLKEQLGNVSLAEFTASDQEMVLAIFGDTSCLFGITRNRWCPDETLAKWVARLEEIARRE